MGERERQRERRDKITSTVTHVTQILAVNKCAHRLWAMPGLVNRSLNETRLVHSAHRAQIDDQITADAVYSAYLFVARIASPGPPRPRRLSCPSSPSSTPSQISSLLNEIEPTHARRGGRTRTRTVDGDGVALAPHPSRKIFLSLGLHVGRVASYTVNTLEEGRKEARHGGWTVRRRC